jgi:hypothetical protein
MPMKFAMLMVNIRIYNHPSKNFGKEEFRVVVVLVRAYEIKRG